MKDLELSQILRYTRSYSVEMSLSSLVSSQEFPVLANLSVLLNFLALASLIRLQQFFSRGLRDIYNIYTWELSHFLRQSCSFHLYFLI